jgi:hypothetical protein
MILLPFGCGCVGYVLFVVIFLGACFESSIF